MLVSLPEVSVYKSEQNILMVEIWIAEELFHSFHPFLFSDFLQQKVFHLETIGKNLKYPLSGCESSEQAYNGRKTIQQYHSNLNTNKGSYLQENHTAQNLDSNTLSEASKIDFKHNNSNEQNLSSNQNEGLNKNNFITLSKISEPDKIEIIKTRNEVPSEQSEQKELSIAQQRR